MYSSAHSFHLAVARAGAQPSIRDAGAEAPRRAGHNIRVQNAIRGPERRGSQGARRGRRDSGGDAAGGGADDGPGRPGVEEAESRFRRACREGGAEGGNAYLLWLAGAPLRRAGP